MSRSLGNGGTHGVKQSCRSGDALLALMTQEAVLAVDIAGVNSCRGGMCPWAAYEVRAGYVDPTSSGVCLSWQAGTYQEANFRKKTS